MRYAKRLAVLVLFVPATLCFFLQAPLHYLIHGTEIEGDDLWVIRLIEWAER